MEFANTAPVIIKGRYFYQGSKRFLIRGVVYQPPPGSTLNGHPTGLLANDTLAQLERDIVLFKELGLNTIFVYSVDNTKEHEQAMRALADAGIYVLVGLSTPHMSINRYAPLDSYRTELLEDHFRTVDCFDQYPNTLGFFVGNEVINDNTTTKAAEVIRAVGRDVKQYMRLKAEILGSRIVPVGYSASSVMNILKETAEYLTAGSRDERLDFFGYNNYSWAGPSNMDVSGWAREVTMLSPIKVPMFLSEYGANARRPRVFDEARALYSPAMTEVFSGGCVYEYSNGLNRYGLVTIATNGARRRRQDFHNLKANLMESLGFEVPAADASEAEHVEWAGEFPAVGRRHGANWQATPNIPPSPVDWNAVEERLRDQDWVRVEHESVT